MLLYLQALLKAIRVRTLVASISPVLIGSCLAIKIGRFSLYTALATLICALCIQILTNLANDYFDYKKGADSATRIGPQRVMQMGLMKESTMINTMVLFSSLTILTAIPLIQIEGSLVVELLFLALAFAYLYTATPFALAYTGLADIVVFLCFGPLAVYMTQLLQTGIYQCSSFFGIGAGAMSAALLTLNNLRDYDEDKNSNKKTLVVRFGRNFGRVQIIFYYFLLFLPLMALVNHPVLFAIPFLIGLLPLTRFLKVKTSAHFARYFPKFTLLFWLYTLCVCSALIML